MDIGQTIGTNFQDHHIEVDLSKYKILEDVTSEDDITEEQTKETLETTDLIGEEVGQDMGSFHEISGRMIEVAVGPG